MDGATHCAPARPHAATIVAPPVDLAHLRRYTLGNMELQREVLALFAEQTLTTLAALRSASTPKPWREAAHTLKGAALAVGAWSVAAAGQQAEVADCNDATRDDVLAQIEAAVAEARGFIASLQ